MTPPRSPKTKEDQFKHAKKRAIERYGFWLDLTIYDSMILTIQKGNADFLGRESNNRTHWMVEGYMIVVYDQKRKSITTFLPPDAIHNYLPIGSFQPGNLKDTIED